MRLGSDEDRKIGTRGALTTKKSPSIWKSTYLSISVVDPGGRYCVSHGGQVVRVHAVRASPSGSGVSVCVASGRSDDESCTNGRPGSR